MNYKPTANDWRKARETYAAKSPENNELTEQKLGLNAELQKLEESDSWFSQVIFRLGEGIIAALKVFFVIALWGLGVGLVIFIIGSIFGILKFGWNQL